MLWPELSQLLEKAGVDKSSYSFDTEYPNEAFCLIDSNGIWEVYYSEHGTKTNLQTFSSEEIACAYLFVQLTNQVD